MDDQKIIVKNYSWNKAFSFVYNMQKRIYKSAYVFDTNRVLLIQKLLLNSNSLRLLSIRDVTQLNSVKKIAGVDNKLSLTFSERFELNEFLKCNCNNWYPNILRKVFFLDENNIVKKYSLPTIADRAWYSLIKFILDPVYEASFNPRLFGFRQIRSIYQIQNLFFLNLCSSSFGSQKRILKLELDENFSSFDLALFMGKIIAPRNVKLGIFRALKKNLILSYSKFFADNLSIIPLFLNILLNGIELFHPCIRSGSTIILFLKPTDNESILVSKLKNFLLKLGLRNLGLKINIFSAYEGVDFLMWYFKITKHDNFLCYPLCYSL